MSGIKFEILVPTEAEERRLNGVTDDTLLIPQLVDNTSGVDIIITPVQQHTASVHTYAPTPTTSTYKQRNASNEVLVDIESSSASGEHYNQAAGGASVDDFCIGMPQHVPKAPMMRTRSHGHIADDDTTTKDAAASNPSATSANHNGGMRKSWDGYLKDFVTSAKKTKPSDRATLDIATNAPMETVVREILKKMRLLKWALLQTGYDKDYLQISVAVEAGYVQERLLTMLTEWGIGERDGSSISMVACSLVTPKLPMERSDGEDIAEHEELMATTAGAWDRFMNSMRARLNVAKIVESVRQDATITFDFLSLLIIAALLAAFGLVEDSTIFLASSMLISPLMGPIIAATFGTVIKDGRLTKFGIVNELIGIAITTLVGFLFGLVMFNVDDSFSRGEGLTNEMLSRCELHSLIVGIFIAIPSGAAVAISILGENIGSLVGVAISASLLPPAVNSGVLWALATMFMFHQQDDTKYNVVIHTKFWSEHQAVELFVLGSLSMAVTISNVICVYAAGTLFLKIKEVAPIVSRDQRQFWKHDVKLVRNYQEKSRTNSVGGERTSMSQQLADDFADFQDSDAGRLMGQNAEMLRNVGRPAYQHTWSPMNYHHHPYRHHLHPSDAASRVTRDDVEHLYLNMAHPLNANAQFKRHYTMSGSGSSKTVAYRKASPPKYRSLIHDQIFANHQAHQRRSSMSQYNPSAAASIGNGTARLGHIQEIDSTNSSLTGVHNDSTAALAIDRRSSMMAASRRKFIVTPATEDSLKK